MTNENKPMTIKDGWFVCGANFDCDEPYIILANEHNGVDEIKVPVPKSVAYYLRTHWCGSQQMHDTIKENATSEALNLIKQALRI